MNGHEPARRGEGAGALLPSYSVARVLLIVVLAGLIAVLWGAEDQIVAAFSGDNEYFQEDFQDLRKVLSAMAGTLLVVVLLGEEVIIATLLAGMTIVTFTQVVLRYVFNSGILWGLEASIYMFAWLVLLGMSYGVKVSTHIGVDLVVKALPRGPQRVIGAVAVAACIVYAVVMLWGSYTNCAMLSDLWRDLFDSRACGYIDALVRLNTYGEDIHLPRWLMTIMLPVGFALLAFRLIEVLLGILSGRRMGFDLGDEVKDALKDHRPQGGDAAAGR